MKTDIEFQQNILLGKKPDDGTTMGQPFPKGMGGCDNFRIPGLVTLKDGTLVACTDARWNQEKDGGGSDLVVSRSMDGGKTWHYSFVGYLGDNGNTWNPDSSTLMDPLLMTDSETLYLFADLFPAGYSTSSDSTTKIFEDEEKGFDENGNLLLSGDGRRSYSFYLKNGKIYKQNGQIVENYSVDEWFYLYQGKTYVSNLFFENSPFQVHPTSYIMMMISRDGGKNWTGPRLLDLKPQGIVWLVLGPGKGLVTKDGTMMFSCYDGKKVYLFFSKDEGETWNQVQTQSANGESQLVELEDGTIRMFVRSAGVNKIQYIDFLWLENTYQPGNLVNTEVDNFSNCMVSVLKCSKKWNNQEVLLVSCPSDSAGGIWGGRFDGKIYVFVLDAENHMILKKQHPLHEGFFAYSCMTELGNNLQVGFDGICNVGILYEDDCIDYAAGNHYGICSHITYESILL